MVWYDLCRIDELLRKCLQVDANGLSAVRLLLEKLQGRVDYCIHELPAGLLADPDQFDILLIEFESLCERLEVQSQWFEEVVELRQIANAWRDFQTSPSKYRSFQDVLSNRQLAQRNLVLHPGVRTTRWN